MQADNKNFILAIAISVLIIIGWQYFYVWPQQEKQKKLLETQTQTETTTGQPTTTQPTTTTTTVPGTGVTTGTKPRDQALAENPRIQIETPEKTGTLAGSINLKGAVIDDLHLKQYHETVDDSSPTITLLSPTGTSGGYFAEQGWTLPVGATAKIPSSDTIWVAPQGAVLTPVQPVTLTWDNGEGLLFKRTIALDDRYMFTVTQTVENQSSAAVSLIPYSRVQRQGLPHIQGIWVLYEGPIGVLESKEQRHKYEEIPVDSPISLDSTGGWVGFTDKYWAVAAIPDQKVPVTAEFLHTGKPGAEIFQTHFRAKEAITVPPNGTASATSQVFAGAKVVRIINDYAENQKIDRFDLMIDWGWFYPLTKPMFWLLETIYGIVGNFGFAILISTVIIKLLFFPLANKSYESMSKMKKLQPEMEKLKQRYPDDRMGMQKEMMELYKREKVSPLSGCLPVLLQVPVFFALYKTIYVTIELRHAPFIGWIHDLSAPDPTSLFNLFGLIPWTPPHMLMLGIWPIIMGITMWLQMRLNPAPPDPVQAQLFNWMPLIFTFMLGSFPAGLVIYWAWNNTLSILQQSVIMKRQGVEINFFGNIRNSLPFLNRKSAS